jgi:predicted MFS family arabinose efflux permease
MTTARSRLRSTLDLIRSPARRYSGVIRRPGAIAFFTTAAVARLGVAMTGLGLLFSVRDATGSFAVAGAATGAFAVAEAVAGPQVARLIDRWGQTRIVPVVVVVHVIALVAAIVSVGRVPFALTLAGVIVAGAAIPQPGALSAARWSALIPEPTPLRVAFSLEATINDIVFLTGPILVTLFSTLIAPWAGSAAAATLLAVGCGMLALQRRTAPPPIRSDKATVRGDQRSLRGPAFFAVLGVNLGLGCFFGSVGLLVTAATTAQGLQSLTGLVLSLSSAASIIAGLVYASLRSTPRPQLVQLMATVLVTVGVLVAVWSPTVLGLTIMQFVGGCAIAPLLASSSQITQATVAASARTQGFTWINSASAAGIAAGAALIGGAIEVDGIRSAAVLLAILTLAALSSAVYAARPSCARAPR